ncbi:hypothetical protein T265_05338 [Opisthorchis viverrini]|uniref:Uncharacterized protein n=1 Tax=Opisthorchis viverrini TaxID=6198 RepID=A0A075AFD6_OPIVI|nr:hypothetical protein T265_05338 [Opisthorchis viverrini]KER27614.1 hypothetical protein T265_05338 [Opisthorchis viverrini]
MSKDRSTESNAPWEFRNTDILGCRLPETRGLRLPDEPQEGRNRSWAVEEFSATLDGEALDSNPSAEQSRGSNCGHSTCELSVLSLPHQRKLDTCPNR